MLAGNHNNRMQLFIAISMEQYVDTRENITSLIFIIYLNSKHATKKQCFVFKNKMLETV